MGDEKKTFMTVKHAVKKLNKSQFKFIKGFAHFCCNQSPAIFQAKCKRNSRRE